MIKGSLDGKLRIKIKGKEVINFTVSDKDKDIKDEKTDNQLKDKYDAFTLPYGYHVYIKVHSYEPRYHYTLWLGKIGTEPIINWWNMGKGL